MRLLFSLFFFFKQKTAYEIPKRDWSSDVCSSDLNEIYLLAADPNRQRIQRIVLATFWSEPVAEAEEVLLVDGIQHRDGCPLDNLVLQGRDCERALFSVRLRYVGSA